MNNDSGALLNLQQVADALNCSPTTARRFIAEGTLKAAKIGRLLRVRQCDLDEFIEHMSDPDQWGQRSPKSWR
jgi:excisionase family DNA binding protein